MRFCYHIQNNAPRHHGAQDRGTAAHTGAAAARLTRLVQVIRRYSPTSVVYISHDVHGPPLDESDLRALPDVTVTYDLHRPGDYSAVDRYLRGVDWLAREGVSVDWIVSLTGTDYPLLPLAHAEDELVASRADAVVAHRDLRGAARHTRSAYGFRHRRLPSPAAAAATLRPLELVNRLQPLLRLHTADGLAVGWRTRPPADLRLRTGGPGAALSWRAARFVAEFLNGRPDVVAYFRGCLSPERAVLPTLLCGAADLAVRGDDLRHRLGAGPATDAAVAAAAASGAHFAGPFDHRTDPAVLDGLDTRLAQAAER
ncbi:hypothetical protein GCM10010124_26880 [Pilimelia terevasa]|uniref:Uncharacterized protein n=1 Tax=Pilimelia terevasa TaxID=53372 RepID=A0A8J3BMB2_9ACTN|nr:hypothetical protein [Pilimelia terevasa]GGK32751.1 hypothetical protein GCM10010124_26880 [Pilimelia terevasa]